MEFPPFQEFMATLDKDTISGIFKDASNAAKMAAQHPLSDPSDSFPLQGLSLTFQVSLELLALYHKWLERSL